MCSWKYMELSQIKGVKNVHNLKLREYSVQVSCSVKFILHYIILYYIILTAQRINQHHITLPLYCLISDERILQLFSCWVCHRLWLLNTNIARNTFSFCHKIFKCLKLLKRRIYVLLEILLTVWKMEKNGWNFNINKGHKERSVVHTSNGNNIVFVVGNTESLCEEQSYSVCVCV